MKATIEIINPAKAAEYLKYNKLNRTLSNIMVNKYAQAMQNNQFMVTGDSIKFDKEGILLDGQHRLQAIIKSGTTHQILVVRGLTNDSFACMDIGKKRNCADSLSIKGYKNNSSLSAALRILYILKKMGSIPVTDIRSHGSVENMALMDLIENNPDLEDFIAEMHKFREVIRLIGSGVFGLFFDAYRNNSEKVISFFHKFNDGIDLYNNHPILTLRNYLFKDKLSSKKIPIGSKFFLLASTWNDCKKTDPIRRNIYIPSYSKDVLIPVVR